MSEITTKVWAHRGASGYAPENTLEAFKMAIDMQADGIELDVQLTKDNEVVVIHDETINRVSNGAGRVRDFTLEELKQFKFNKTHPEYESATIPTLKEVLELLKDTDLELNIELKTSIIFYEGLEEQVLEQVKQYGMEDRVWYSSFNHYSVMKIKELMPSAKVGLLYCDGIYNPADYASGLGVEALHPSVNNLKYPKLMEQSKENGIKIHTWTANTYMDMVGCTLKGVDALITNYPDKAKVFATKNSEGKYPFENPFEENENRKFYLFGAGYQGQHFMRRFAGRYVPDKIIDNAQSKWGTMLNGISIDGISAIKEGDCIIIAGDRFAEIAKQLRETGINSYYIYNEQCEWR